MAVGRIGTNPNVLGPTGPTGASGAVGATGATGPAGATGVVDYTIVQNAQTTAYTLVLADANKLVEINSSTGVDLTVPTNATVAFPVGTQIDVIQVGAGQVTLKGAAGVQVDARNSALKIVGQWGVATLVKRATNTWVAFGALGT